MLWKRGAVAGFTMTLLVACSGSNESPGGTASATTGGQGGSATGAGGQSGASTVAAGGGGSGGDTGTGGSAGGAADAGPDGADAAGPSEAGVVCPTTILTSPAGVAFTQTADGEAMGLQLVSSDIVASASDARFLDWNAEVVNCSSRVICSPSAKATFKDAGGASRADFSYSVSASVYDTKIGIPTKCLAPGEHGYVNAIKNLPSAIMLSSLTAADVVFTAYASPDAVPAKDPPKILTAEVVQGGLGTSRVEGQVQVGAAPLSSITMYVWVKDPQGLILDQLLANGSAQDADAIWKYSAGIFDGTVMQFAQTLDFRKVTTPSALPERPEQAEMRRFEAARLATQLERDSVR
jgi:hypothetical protein